MKKAFPILLLILLLSSCNVFKPMTILTPGNDNISVNTEYTPETCILNTGTEDLEMPITSNTVDTSKIGEYTVTYSLEYKDKDYSCSRKVFVNDITLPEITLVAGIDTLFIGEEWIDNGVTVTDNYSTNIEVSTSGTVDTSKAGTYKIIYYAVDEAGNQNSIVRYVTVVNN